MDTPYPIYPSQTDAFKNIAKSFASLIAKESKTKVLSAFKRNDWLAQSLGYKGHADLLRLTQFRKQADQGEPLRCFLHESIRTAINQTFSSKMPDIPPQIIERASLEMKDAEVVLSNTHPEAKLPMMLDEGSKYLSGSFEKIRDEINAAATRKNYVPVLKLDFSELPFNVYAVLMEHSALKAFKVDPNRRDVELIYLKPKGDTSSSNWKIRASLDVWGAETIPADVLNDWCVFRDWLLQFNLVGRTHISERLKDHRFITFHTQSHPEYTLENLYGDLNSEEDKNLLYALLNPNKRLMSDESSRIDSRGNGFNSTLKYSSEILKMIAGEKGSNNQRGWTIDGVFENEAIEHYEPIQSGYAFRLKGMSTVVTVTLTPNAETGWVDYKLSHYIKTPEQMSKYVPSRQSGDYLEYALQRGVTTITDFYKIAVRNGHIPDDSWLIANS